MPRAQQPPDEQAAAEQDRNAEQESAVGTPRRPLNRDEREALRRKLREKFH